MQKIAHKIFTDLLIHASAPLTLCQSDHREVRAAALAVLVNLTAHVELVDGVAQRAFSAVWYMTIAVCNVAVNELTCCPRRACSAWLCSRRLVMLRCDLRISMHCSGWTRLQDAWPSCLPRMIWLPYCCFWCPTLSPHQLC